MSSAYSNKTHITASVMKRMFIAGGKMLEVNKAQVDALNVFPVPDGDTGTNMSLTMMSAIKEINQLSSTSMAEFADKLAKGALRGARGNSGVILSQILKGFSNVIAGCEEVDARNFAKGLREGAQLAYNAVSKPKEGTILTVVRGMAEEAMDVAKRTNSIEKLLNAVLAKGEETLAKTPDMLDVLKRAGVVDSGYGGSRQVAGMGKVYGRTWYTLRCRVPLTVEEKVYTGEKTVRRAVLLGKNRVNLYIGSSISGDTCDKIIDWNQWELPGGLVLPVTVVTETLEEYTLTETRRSQEEAQALGTLALDRQLEALLGEGELLSRQINSQVEGDTLLVTLTAECEEQIGKFVEIPKE